jgi:hypothetical protein
MTWRKENRHKFKISFSPATTNLHEMHRHVPPLQRLPVQIFEEPVILHKYGTFIHLKKCFSNCFFNSGECRVFRIRPFLGESGLLEPNPDPRLQNWHISTGKVFGVVSYRYYCGFIEIRNWYRYLYTSVNFSVHKEFFQGHFSTNFLLKKCR